MTPDGRRPADRQRVHRAQPEHVPEPAAPLRRARGRDPADRHEHVGALRRLRARVRGRQGLRRRVRPAGATRPNPRFLRMLVEVKRFHRARPAPRSTPTRAPTTAARPSATSSPPGATRRTSCGTSWCRWCRACGRARPGPRCSTRPATCSRSSTTTACSSVTGSPEWRTVVGGSRSYVERAAKELTATELSTPVRSVRRASRPAIEIRDDADDVRTLRRGRRRHPRRRGARRCSPTRRRRERAVLGAFASSANETVLHTDASVLPTPPARPGVVELPARPVRGRRRRGAGQLRHEPAAAARRAASTTSSR